jgi:glycosyltransferase involved in cell wall biosynthesis
MGSFVSIVITDYGEGLIANTLARASAQTWSRGEVVAVDDGSRDRLCEVANCFAGPQVKVMRQDNGGGPAAPNKVFTLAQGDFIQWLDDDGVPHLQTIERQMPSAQGRELGGKLAGPRFEVRLDREGVGPASDAQLDPPLARKQAALALPIRVVPVPCGRREGA